MAATLLIGAAIFVLGAAIGVILLVVAGVRAEETDFRQTGQSSLTRRPRRLSSWGARVVLGVYVRDRADVPPAGRPKHDARI
jgi:hypothetical protein